SIFYPFFVLSAITVPLWLLFRLYRGRAGALRTSFARELLLLTFVVYLSGPISRRSPVRRRACREAPRCDRSACGTRGGTSSCSFPWAFCCRWSGDAF